MTPIFGSASKVQSSYGVRALLLVAVAIGASWLGLNSATAACPYSYDGGLPWYDGTICYDDPDCADVGGEPCWVEACSSDCTDGQTWGFSGYQEYGCDENCDYLEYCATCT